MILYGRYIGYWERYCIEDYDSIKEYLEYIRSIIDLGDRNIERFHLAIHHIVPRSFDNSLANEDYNQIKLYHREHFIAHKILAKCFRGIYKCRMDKALFVMCNAVYNEKYEITPEEYELAKSNYLESLSISMSGEGNPMYGVHLSGELNPMYNYDWTDEQRENMSNSIKEWWSKKETRDKMHPDNRGEKNPFYGKKHTEDTKRKISKKISEIMKGNKYTPDFSGENNPMYGRKGSNNPNYGKHFINNGTRNKMVREDEIGEYLNNGWVIGKISL